MSTIAISRAKRDLARKSNYQQSVTIQEILTCSIVHIDRDHPRRFRDRIHGAFENLFTKKILGSQAHCLTTPDYRTTEWTTKKWLASCWVLPPPAQILEQYQSLASLPALPQARRQRTPLKKRS